MALVVETHGALNGAKGWSGSSLRARRVVKSLAMLVVGLVLVAPSATGGDISSADGLLAFWRDVFARPEAAAVQQDVSSVLARRVELGRVLFGDVRLSGEGKRACSSCHDPKLSFTDGRARARGLDGQSLERNVPTLLNSAWGKSFNWDGSASSLEEQALGPILDANELDGNFAQIVAWLSADASVGAQFVSAFPDEPVVSESNILAALAAYERSLVAPETRFDRWIGGDETALRVSEREGFRIFVGKGGCVACHAGWRFSDDGFHDIGLAVGSGVVGSADTGKKGVVAFKTPTLRAVAGTGPYMHDGSLDSLEAVVEHYSERMIVRKGLSALLVRRLNLSADEKARLVAFLKTL